MPDDLKEKISALATRVGEEIRNLDVSGGSSADSYIKTYTDPAQFGCNYDMTLSEIYAGLPINSLFLGLIGDFTNPGNVPATSFYTVWIVKGSSGCRGGCWLYGKQTSHPDYRCNLIADCDELDQDNWRIIPASASTTVGSGTKPVYLNSGEVTASTSTVGSGTVPVYLNSGTVTASTSTVGSATKPVYLNSGTITASGSTVGSSTTPVYLNSGTITATSLTDEYSRWRYAYVGQSSNTTTLPWYRFASISISDVNSDRDICFKVNAGYSTNYSKCGLLTAHIRLGSTVDTFSNAQFYWEFADTAITLSNFVLAYKLGSSTTEVELWVKIDATYLFYFFEVLYEGNRTRHLNTDYWTLYSHSSQGYADSITSGYTQITSTLSTLQNSAKQWDGATKTTGTSSPNSGSAGDIHFQYVS